jgi:hypothetical protein
MPASGHRRLWKYARAFLSRDIDPRVRGCSRKGSGPLVSLYSGSVVSRVTTFHGWIVLIDPLLELKVKGIVVGLRESLEML